MGIHLLDFGEGVRIVSQVFSRPAIYLDHWAMSEFSQNDELGSALVTHIHRTDGVICISDTNMAEVCRASDRRHAAQIDRFIFRALPAIYCIDLANILLDPSYGPLPAVSKPPENGKMARAILEQQSSGGHGLFQHVWDTAREEVAVAFDESCEEVAATIRRQRASADFVRQARNAGVDRPASRTRLIMAELLRPIFLNGSEAVTCNDGADFQHAMAALVYCDFALLDGKWADRARSASNRLRRQGLDFSRCYSARKKGLTQFLEALSALPDHVSLDNRLRWE